MGCVMKVQLQFAQDPVRLDSSYPGDWSGARAMPNTEAVVSFTAALTRGQPQASQHAFPPIFLTLVQYVANQAEISGNDHRDPPPSSNYSRMGHGCIQFQTCPWVWAFRRLIFLTVQRKRELPGASHRQDYAQQTGKPCNDNPESYDANRGRWSPSTATSEPMFLLAGVLQVLTSCCHQEICRIYPLSEPANGAGGRNDNKVSLLAGHARILASCICQNHAAICHAPD